MSRTVPIDELYLTWLHDQVCPRQLNLHGRVYWKLLRALYSKEFVWFIPNDDNRVEDGRDLRFEFSGEQGLVDVDPGWLDLGCSMLEMLVGLSKRLSFEAGREPCEWFWHLLDNLELADKHDQASFTSDEVDSVLDRVIFRTYDRDGSGGLFPLRRAKRDQRRVELWYQLSAYLLEQE